VYHPTTRVLAVLELLQARGRLSGPELAERLEVDLRTVRRYVTMLQDLGIPVETERGRHGGYRLRPGFRLPPLLFTDEEAFAAALGLLTVRRTAGGGSAAAVEGALAKLERALPPDVRERIAAVQGTLTIDAPVRPDQPTAAVVLAVGLAAHRRTRLHVHYGTADGDRTEREIDPWAIVQLRGRWYLPAFCHLRGGPRLFRLDRIESVDPLKTRFAPPADFDPLAFVREALAAAPGAWQVAALLDLPPEEARQRVAPHEGTLEPCDSGGVLLRFSVEDLPWAVRYLIGLGCRFIVREPDELRSLLRVLARDLAAAAEPEPDPASGEAIG
jgi:predicted DNA-binding transcriptional regulator YafY